MLHGFDEWSVVFMKSEAVAHFSLQGYFRAAKAAAGLGDRTKAIKYLKDGIGHCNISSTEDLRNYLQTFYEEDPLCMYAQCTAH
jgi:hypothetical protein